MLPILVNVTIECEFDRASFSLQRALNGAVPAFVGHCYDVQIYEKLGDALKLLHVEFGVQKSIFRCQLQLVAWTAMGLKCVSVIPRPVNLAKRNKTIIGPYN